MLRGVFLWLSQRKGLFDLAKHNGFARRIASRFVAGETIESAIHAARRLNQRGISVSLDLLGESVANAAEARLAAEEVTATVDALAASRVDGNVSIKLTQMGLGIDDDLCSENVCHVVEHARERGVFVRIDMEGSDYTQRTLDLFYEMLQPRFGNGTGVVIQSYLRRSAADIEDLIRVQARVRLCKGAYAEPATIAFQTRQEVSDSFIRLLERLLGAGDYPAIATHDDRLIEHALRFVEANGIGAERFEFQMLFGVRRDLQQALRSAGYNVRVYVPFGTAWYPYLMRRLAERPANVAFMVGSVLKETVSRR
ncbi:MAG: proline dehydrogenase family protein [Gemmatimonadales bacterium]